ncbi:insulin-induced gene 1 protein [Otolemur garnettii]|uniref:insulin-induced gene 1 protein n=1 Tax=Otolemur garnettii TaxID=30611 RepID=UPI0002740DF3|nr:insulin-induced gene 1 protein [Otolemur garnettii]XP_012661990.1 insulin-induced gene 1 protein [Otolemur garnettii]XP_023370199.1 insulin-induced gene 1 protein [Otolemur garnettii]
MPRLHDRFWSCPCAHSARRRGRPRAGAAGPAAKVGEMIDSSVLDPAPPAAHRAQDPGPAHGGPAGFGRASSWHHHLVQRSLVLFLVGVVLALVLNLLQIQRNVTLFPEEVIATVFSSAWWVPPCCGTAAAVVGVLYPCIDSHLGEPHKFKREWASVMRCIAVFVGINHASAKLDFANNVQLSLTLAALSLGLWWTFDRSRSGLGLGITIAFLATLITQFLVYNGVYQYTSPDFLYIRSWLPCIFFSGGVTVGNIGRQLAMGVPEKPHSD